MLGLKGIRSNGAGEWTQVFEAYSLFLLADGKAKGTINCYEVPMRCFGRWCEAHGTSALRASPTHVQAWIATRFQEWKPATAYRAISALRSFYRWLKATGRRRDDPTLGLKLRTVRHPPHRPYSATEFGALLVACDNDPPRAVRDRAILRLFAGAGIRVGELVAMNLSDVDWDQGIIRIHGKGAKERDVAPGPTAMAALREYVNRQGGRVFDIGIGAVEAMIHRREDEAGLGRIHPHGFRHTFAIHFIEQSRDLDALRVTLGHETLAQAAEYAAYTAKERALDQQRRMDLGAGPC